MTTDAETRIILRDLATGQRDLVEGQRDINVAMREHSRRFDGLSSRMDHFERMLSAVTLQASLLGGDMVELKSKLGSLDTAKWDETSAKVKRLERRLDGIGSWFRKRAVVTAIAVASGAGGLKLIESLFG